MYHQKENAMALKIGLFEDVDHQFCSSCGNALTEIDVTGKELSADNITTMRYIDCHWCGKEDTLVFKMEFAGHTGKPE